MKAIILLTTTVWGLVSGLATPSKTGTSQNPAAQVFPRQPDQDDDLCARQTYSAVLNDLEAPSLGLLQETCRTTCDAARSRCTRYLYDNECAWVNLVECVMQSFHINNQKRCANDCDLGSVWQGNCACNIEADKVWVIGDADFKEKCDAFTVGRAIFTAEWANRLSTEDPAAPCQSVSPGDGN